jgi:hypothetical protein
MHTKTSTRRLFIVISVALTALAILLLSWPRFQASMRYLPVELALDRYYREQEIPSNRLDTLVKFSQQAIDYHDHYRYHDGLSLLQLLRGLDLETPALERRDAYRLSEQEALESLRQAPAQSGTWLRVATIRGILHDPPESVIESWKMSVFTGRTQATLMPRRVEVGLLFLDSMDQEAVGMLRDQLLLGWRANSRSMIPVLDTHDRQLEKTRKLIGNLDVDAIAEMEESLEALP